MLPHEMWLFKSEHDLKSADILLHNDDPVLDIAIYHTQQSGEKALKAFLSYNKADISKTHDLALLLEYCIEYDQSFNNLYEDCLTLSPYATLYRYPSGNLLPSIDEVETALMAAKRIKDFVQQVIS